MIHDICLQWPEVNIEKDFNLVDVAGDTIILNITVDGIDLTDYKIRCALYGYSNNKDLANELSGGDDEQIIEMETDSGMSKFQIIIPAEEDSVLITYSNIEVEIENESGYVFTILKQQIKLLDRQITWKEPS
jgi:hypothetical protein